MPDKPISSYVKREDVENILKDSRITHLHVHGTIETGTENSDEWNIKVTGHAAVAIEKMVSLATARTPVNDLPKAAN